MATLLVEIDVPPIGKLEVEGGGESPTDEEMTEERNAREWVVGEMTPYLAGLPERSPHRSGNVSRVLLQGRTEWSRLNHYALVVTVDVGDPGLEEGLLAVLPAGSTVKVTGTYDELGGWPPPGGTTGG